MCCRKLCADKYDACNESGRDTRLASLSDRAGSIKKGTPQGMGTVPDSKLEKGSGRSRGVYRTLSGADRSQRSGIVGDGRRYFILSAESDAVDVGHHDTAAELCFVVYDVFGGRIWLALLSAACSSGEARASQRRDSPRPFMGNMASSHQFVLLQP